MGIYLNPGNDLFYSTVTYSEIYVDKTMLIFFTNKWFVWRKQGDLRQPSQKIRKVDGREYADGLLQQGLRFERIVFQVSDCTDTGF